MKRLLLPLLFVCLFAVGCASNPESPITDRVLQDEFIKGQAAYDAGNYDEAYAILKPVAYYGNAEAQYMMAYMYGMGYGVPVDLQESASMLQYAANQGHDKAMYALAMSYLGGEGVMINPERASYWVTKAAEAVYMSQRGWTYTMDKVGDFSFSNPTWVAGLYRNPGASYRLARYHYVAANDISDQEVLYLMGREYLVGDQVAQDLPKARTMLQEAAATPNPYQADAQYELGMIYLTGNGVEMDVATSREWLTMAAAQGHEQAARELALLGD